MRCSAARWRSQLDTKASFGTSSAETRRGDLIESLDQLDAAVELLDPSQFRSMLAFPCAARSDSRSEAFESPVELGELDVVSGDLRVEVSDAVFDFTAPGGTCPSADRAEPVEVLLSPGPTPEGAVSVLLLAPALVGERVGLP